MEIYKSVIKPQIQHGHAIPTRLFVTGHASSVHPKLEFKKMIAGSSIGSFCSLSTTKNMDQAEPAWLKYSIAT
jgi:hypothetical protein